MITESYSFRLRNTYVYTIEDSADTISVRDNVLPLYFFNIVRGLELKIKQENKIRRGLV